MINIEKVKMKKINHNTLLCIGDRVFLKPYFLSCTLLDDLTDGFLVVIENNNSYTFVTRIALENHFLKIL